MAESGRIDSACTLSKRAANKPNAAKIRIQVTGPTTAPAHSPNKPLRQNAAEIRCPVTSATTAPARSPNEPLRPNLLHQKWPRSPAPPTGTPTEFFIQIRRSQTPVLPIS
ncbi:hypothetical protein NDU88_006819 [Pleurodeles waltl]|uniref:Uncharacterized protein n=1 Tax=Pleurodeles waltl TaxID=8319 RepID=A0AAV7X2M3_PLEWA|nr:hypothetical protein NDU88_006819 [Pleurodeles waltl]